MGRAVSPKPPHHDIRPGSRPFSPRHAPTPRHHTSLDQRPGSAEPDEQSVLKASPVAPSTTKTIWRGNHRRTSIISSVRYPPAAHDGTARTTTGLCRHRVAFTMRHKARPNSRTKCARHGRTLKGQGFSPRLPLLGPILLSVPVGRVPSARSRLNNTVGRTQRD